MKKREAFPPPCTICGIPSELMGTKAEFKEHDRLERERRKTQPTRERAAAAWIAGRASSDTGPGASK